ncbi:hypothetical protein Tco_1121267 [Tanacetum coccineum]|uniref:Uncharacterized protein n=1 Tax=Tanacetum coccineum TaxID=301880 RepID=A0ABQ5IX83_9ASTR
MTEANTTEDTKDAHVTLMPATPVVQQQSSSMSDLVSKSISPTTDEGIDSILNPRTESTTLVNVPIFVATETPATTTTIPPPLFPITQSSQQTPDTTTTTTYSSTTPPPIPNFASLFGFNQRMKEAVDVAIQLNSNKLKEEAQAENQAFLNSLDSNIQKIINDQVKTETSKIKSKVEKYVTESLGAEVLIHSTNQPQTSYGIASSFSKLELKRILMDKIEENKSIDRSDVQKNLYNALVEAYNTDKDLLSSFGDARKLSHPKEPTRKESKTTSSSKGASRSQPTNLNETTHLEFITGDDDVILAREVHDVRQWHPPTSPTPDYEWHITKNVSDLPPQHWITDLAQTTGTCKSVDELKYHLEEVFKATNEQLDWNNPEGTPYPHNHSKPLPLILNARGRLTKAADYGQVKWIKDRILRTTWSVVPINYDKHAYWGTYHWGPKCQRFYGYATNMETSKDVYSRHRIIAVICLKIMKFFGYSHLEEITVRRQDDVLYKFREGDFKRLRC